MCFEMIFDQPYIKCCYTLAERATANGNINMQRKFAQKKYFEMFKCGTHCAAHNLNFF